MVAARFGETEIWPKLEEDLIRASGAVSAYCKRNMFWHLVEERVPEPLPGTGCREDYTLGCWPVGRIVEALGRGGNTLPLEGLAIGGRDLSTLELTPDTRALRRVRYTAGFLSPDLAVSWSAAAAIAAGSWTAPPASEFRFVATGAGETGGSEPAWPTTLGATVEDGDVIWAAEISMPPSVGQQAAVAAFAELIYGGGWDAHRLGVIAESGAAGYVGYAPDSGDLTDAMPRPVLVEWGRWRS